MGYVVTREASIRCPHGGVVRFLPGGRARLEIQGSDVVSSEDQSSIEGCTGSSGDPCSRIEWIVPGHPVLTIDDRPVLTSDTPGTCVTFVGLPTGPPVFATFQTIVEA
ncbi:MAG: hypothetical protein M3527_08370 [Actinomycetota bacterium]|nr:hypothetical protein [Acidimicrobiia bacterium]MDQ3294448.1 hypothetical protein [Actinomycetota bacterium]